MPKYKKCGQFPYVDYCLTETGWKGVLQVGEIAVSVIVPIYNVAPWLEDCLTSLEKQGLKISRSFW